MCVNYTPTRKELLSEKFAVSIDPAAEWKSECWQDYPAPIIRQGKNGDREALLAAYSMIPKTKLPPGVKRFSTMNARAETIGQLRSYSKQWREGNLCLVPVQNFFEPNYESGHAERWKIGMKDGSDFAVAGLYKRWEEPEGGESYSFTQITINSDEHPLMRRFHKPGDEKRSLVILPADAYDDWLGCKDTERARSFLTLYSAELMVASAALKKEPKRDLFS